MFVVVGVVIMVSIGLAVFFLIQHPFGFNATSTIPPKGQHLGTWTINYHSESGKVSAEFPEAELARFIIYRLHEELFYHGNGSKQMDQSGPLRETLKQLLNDPSTSIPWEYADKEAAGAIDFSLRGDLYEGDMSRPGLIGVVDKPQKQLNGMLALVKEALHRDVETQERVKIGISRLISWHEDEGPVNNGKDFWSRAVAAYQQDQA